METGTTGRLEHNADGTCGACAKIAFKHASGGTLSPDASQTTTAKAWQSPFAGTREWRDALGRALDAKLAAYEAGKEVERAVDAAVALREPLKLTAVEHRIDGALDRARSRTMLRLLAVEDYERAMRIL